MAFLLLAHQSAAVGMPLVFTQEDFLVYYIFTRCWGIY